MLTLTVDFNALANGFVRGRAGNAADDPNLVEGSLALLTDGEGNEALGTVREVRDGLVFAAVDWDTWSPAGAIQWVAPPVPEHAKPTTMKITGLIEVMGASTNVPAPREFAERQVLVAA
jgi:hypothetical protein